MVQSNDVFPPVSRLAFHPVLCLIFSELFNATLQKTFYFPLMSSQGVNGFPYTFAQAVSLVPSSSNCLGAGSCVGAHLHDKWAAKGEMAFKRRSNRRGNSSAPLVNGVKYALGNDRRCLPSMGEEVRPESRCFSFRAVGLRLLPPAPPLSPHPTAPSSPLVRSPPSPPIIYLLLLLFHLLPLFLLSLLPLHHLLLIHFLLFSTTSSLFSLSTFLSFYCLFSISS